MRRKTPPPENGKSGAQRTRVSVPAKSLRSKRGSGVASDLTPLAVPTITSLPQFGGEYESKMFWGTYRPHLYLGIRSRQPQSLLAGLMWLAPSRESSHGWALRHTCEESDHLPRYGWLRHDGSTYGSQEIVDGEYAIRTDFAKHLDGARGHGGDWSARIRVDPHVDDALEEDEQEQQAERLGKASLLFYIMDEALGTVHLEASGAATELSPEGSPTPFASGSSSTFGNWKLYAFAQGGSVQVAWQGLRTRHTHNLTALVTHQLLSAARAEKGLELPRTAAPGSNLAIIQIDVVFVSGLRSNTPPDWTSSRVLQLSGAELDKKLKDAEEEFDARFHRTFHLPQNDEAGGAQAVQVGKAALSNLLGGMGYFYGRSRIAIPPALRQVAPPRRPPAPLIGRLRVRGLTARQQPPVHHGVSLFPIVCAQ
eukprot:jgi/Mesen1/1754/ME000014S01162